MEDHFRPVADEDAVVIPDSWRRRSYPRRGGIRRSGYGESVASTAMANAGARLRALLAVAGDAEYQNAVDRLERCRRTASQRAVVSFLVPTRCVFRELPGGLYVNIRLSPGIFIGHVDDSGHQYLDEIRLDGHPADDSWSQSDGRPFGELDPVIASEVLGELTEVAS